MEASSAVEYKELLILDERFITLCGVVEAYRNVAKPLKLCRKLVKIERAKLKKSKIPLTPSDMDAVLWRYDDFSNIIKQLFGSKKANALNKATFDLDNLITTVENEMKVLRAKLGVSHATEYGPRAISSLEAAGKIEQGPLGGSAFITDKEVVSTVTELKNRLAGDAS